MVIQPKFQNLLQQDELDHFPHCHLLQVLPLLEEVVVKMKIEIQRYQLVLLVLMMMLLRLV
jgi:hypothetical protein